MRKFILILSALALVISCGQTRKWSDTDRESVRKMIREYRDQSAIRYMEDANYQVLEDSVMTAVELKYPDFRAFGSLPSQNDTLKTVVIDGMGYTIGPDFERLPLLFPYEQMVSEGILPADLTEAQVNQFYTVFTEKVKELYNTPYMFTVAILQEPGVPAQLATAMQESVQQVTAPPVKEKHRLRK